MSLYAKEVATPERVVAAVERFSPNEESFTLPGDHEAALVLWINQAVTALNLRINQQSNSVNKPKSRNKTTLPFKKEQLQVET